jgi:hypothetical protein
MTSWLFPTRHTFLDAAETSLAHTTPAYQDQTGRQSELELESM